MEHLCFIAEKWTGSERLAVAAKVTSRTGVGVITCLPTSPVVIPPSGILSLQIAIQLNWSSVWIRETGWDIGQGLQIVTSHS